jgi:hypothetical protein
MPSGIIQMENNQKMGKSQNFEEKEKFVTFKRLRM